jgi:hypothetical protein
MSPKPPLPRTPPVSLDRRVEHLEALLTLALADPVREARKAAGVGDPCSAEILRLSVDWVRAGELKKAVKATTGESESTIKRRIGDLIEAGALQPMGAKASQRYRNTILLG